jgi:ketosteroid isomerase-like protein
MTGTGRDTVELLDELFAAVQAGDIDTVASLYAEDLAVWHNLTGQVQAKAENLDLLRYWSTKVAEMRYEVLERQVFAGGAVQRHVIHGTANGADLNAQVCIVFHLRDGLIAEIFEYLDAGAVSAVFG